MTNNTVVIIHGSYGGPEENWFPWLAAELRAAHYSVIVPAFPTPEGQSVGTWTRVFQESVGALDGDMVLVGHSLGAGFILGLLEGANVTVAAAFLVSGFVGRIGIEEFDSVNASFIDRDFDWHAVRQHVGMVRLYQGDNDPYVSLEKGRQLEKELGVELEVIPDGGHLNTAAGFVTFPQLRDDILATLTTSRS